MCLHAKGAQAHYYRTFISARYCLLTATAVATAGIAAVVASGDTAVATAIAAAAVASKVQDKQSNYNKPNGRILKPITQTVHLYASFILHREGVAPSSLI